MSVLLIAGIGAARAKKLAKIAVRTADQFRSLDRAQVLELRDKAILAIWEKEQAAVGPTKPETPKPNRSAAPEELKARSDTGSDEETELVRQALEAEPRFLYRLGPVIGQGAHSTVFRATRQTTRQNGDPPLAVKVETDSSYRFLRPERKILLDLAQADSSRIARLWDYVPSIEFRPGTKQATIRALVLIEYPASLPDFIQAHPNSFAHVARELFLAMDVIHRHGVVYMDVSETNFRFRSTDPCAQVVVIDFGGAEYFKDNLGFKKQGKKLQVVEGTAPFQSTAARDRLPQSYKDDLESVIYLLWHLFYGPVPWAKDETLFTKSRRSKLPTNKFGKVFAYLDDLEFEDVPDTEELLSLLGLDSEDCHNDEQDPKPQWTEQQKFQILPFNKDIENIPGLTMRALQQLKLAGVKTMAHLQGLFYGADANEAEFADKLRKLGVDNADTLSHWITVASDT